MVWYGMVWYGMVWYGMVWYGMVWYGTVRYGTARHGTARHGTARHGMAWHGMAWHGMAWHGMAWHGTAGTQKNRQGKLFLTAFFGCVGVVQKPPQKSSRPIKENIIYIPCASQWKHFSGDFQAALLSTTAISTTAKRVSSALTAHVAPRR